MMNNIMTEQSNIERIVMQRVHLIRALRFAISSGALSTLVSALALWGLGTQVWVSHVLQNAPTSILDLPGFYLTAFLHTRPLVQGLIVLSVAALLFVAHEISRALAFLKAQNGL
jgi:hypothetical protein